MTSLHIINKKQTYIHLASWRSKKLRNSWLERDVPISHLRKVQWFVSLWASSIQKMYSNRFSLISHQLLTCVRKWTWSWFSKKAYSQMILAETSEPLEWLWMPIHKVDKLNNLIQMQKWTYKCIYSIMHNIVSIYGKHSKMTQPGNIILTTPFTLTRCMVNTTAANTASTTAALQYIKPWSFK